MRRQQVIKFKALGVFRASTLKGAFNRAENKKPLKNLKFAAYSRRKKKRNKLKFFFYNYIFKRLLLNKKKLGQPAARLLPRRNKIKTKSVNSASLFRQATQLSYKRMFDYGAYLPAFTSLNQNYTNQANSVRSSALLSARRSAIYSAKLLKNAFTTNYNFKVSTALGQNPANLFKKIINKGVFFKKKRRLLKAVSKKRILKKFALKIAKNRGLIFKKSKRVFTPTRFGGRFDFLEGKLRAANHRVFIYKNTYFYPHGRSFLRFRSKIKNCLDSRLRQKANIARLKVLLPPLNKIGLNFSMAALSRRKPIIFFDSVHDDSAGRNLRKRVYSNTLIRPEAYLVFPRQRSKENFR